MQMREEGYLQNKISDRSKREKMPTNRHFLQIRKSSKLLFSVNFGRFYECFDEL